MTARLYGLWVLSVILALVFEFLTPGIVKIDSGALVGMHPGGSLCIS